jgi:hypothetical protein
MSDTQFKKNQASKQEIITHNQGENQSITTDPKL